MNKLSVILKKCSNKKFRKGYVKYLAALDYKEFETLFIRYVEIVTTVSGRYASKKIKFLSKDWFKKRAANKKYDLVYELFYDANHIFILVLNKNLTDKNIKREKVLNEINEIQKSIHNVYNREILFNVPPTKFDIINVKMLLTSSTYAEQELKRLLEELDKIRKS